MIDQLVADNELMSPPDGGVSFSELDLERSHTLVLGRARGSGTRSVILEQALNEFCIRLGKGEKVNPEAFCRDYPSIEHSLRELLEAQLFFLNHPELMPAAWPDPGTTFLGFNLERELGRGAFARVFLATEPALGHRRVALKVGPGAAVEAKTIGQLEHPNVVPVFSAQYDTASELAAICMPYLGSATLADVIGQVFTGSKRPKRASVILDAIAKSSVGGAPQSKATGSEFPRDASYEDGVLHLAIQMAGALAFVHGRGIHHRDLKPSNVLMSDAGQPMLLDFNLSADANSSRPRAGGTLPFMPPEQLLALDTPAESADNGLDARADLFSLGVILYQLLVGQHPFGVIPSGTPFNESRALLLARQKSGATPLRHLRSDLSPALCAIVESCLRFERNGRPASAEEVARGLRALATPRRRLARGLRRHTRTLVAASLLLGTICGSATYALIPSGTYAERQYQQGMAALVDGDPARALRYLHKAVEADPGSAAGFFALGRAYQQLQPLPKWELARENYQKADKLNPNGRTKACQGYCLAQQKRWDEATRLYREAVNAGFGTPVIHNNLGYCYLKSGNTIDAKMCFDTAIMMDATFQTAYHNRARLPIGQQVVFEVHRQALADIYRAIELSPSATTDLHLDAAKLCAMACKQERAYTEQGIEHLRQAIRLGEQPQYVLNDATLSRLTRDPSFQEVLASTQPTQLKRTSNRLLDVSAAD